jgi:hypothetical protein
MEKSMAVDFHLGREGPFARLMLMYGPMPGEKSPSYQTGIDYYQTQKWASWIA